MDVPPNIRLPALHMPQNTQTTQTIRSVTPLTSLRSLYSARIFIAI